MSLIPQKLLLKLNIFLGVGILSCCVPYGKDLSNVVEKSKRDKPEWASLDPSVFHDNQFVIRFVYYRDGLVDLPLGLFQGERGIKTLSEYKIYKTIVGEIREISSNSPVWLDERTQKLLKKSVSEVLGHHKGNLSSIKDIYYEKVETIASLRDLPKNSYRIYFLAEFKKDVVGVLLIDLVNLLKESQEAELRNVSGILENQLR